MNPNDLARWESIRANGMARFILIRGVLMWGIPMLIFMSFISDPFTNGYLSQTAIVHYVTWLFAGVIFGVFMWYVSEWRYKKATSNMLPHNKALKFVPALRASTGRSCAAPLN